MTAVDQAAELRRRIRVEAGFRPSPTGRIRLAGLTKQAEALVASLIRTAAGR